MSQNIMTIDGPGVVHEIEVSRSGTQYRVAGNGFEGWYASHEILSELDEDETTTNIPFTKDTDANGDSTVVPDNDPHATDGVTLPWNPEPTDEWDGQLTQEPEEADISLTPSKSTKGGDFTEDPEDSNRVFGRNARISWNADGTQGTLPGGKHQISVETSRDTIDWYIKSNDGKVLHRNSHEAENGHSLNDFDFDDAQDEMERDASTVGRKHAALTRQAFRQYVALLESDPMIREAAWSDVRKKASRLFREGAVTVKKVTPREIFASVVGDHGTYDTNVNRKNAFGQGVTWWNCDCEWGKHAYLRQRTFVGRMCSHAFATYTAMQAKTVPTNKNKRIDNKTERHSLGAAEHIERGDGPIDTNYRDHDTDDVPFTDQHEGYDPTERPDSSDGGDPWQDAGQNSQYVRHSAFNPGSEPEDEFVYRPQMSLAQRQGGLMVWDDDLAKVMKQIYNQQPPTTPGDPSAAPGGLGAPADMGAPGASPMSADPAAGAPVDPSMGGAVDPSMGGDPSMGDPAGAGLPPAGATPSFVRNTTGPTQDPSQVTAGFHADGEQDDQEMNGDNWPGMEQHAEQSSYPVRTALRHQFAEYTDGNTDDLFEEWGEPNSEDADTFNTVDDLTDDNDVPADGFPEDDLWGKHSAVSDSDPQPGQDVNEPIPGEQLPVVPRGTQARRADRQHLVIPNDSSDPHVTPYLPAAKNEFMATHPAQHYVPEIFRTAPPQNRESSLDWLLADNDASSDASWQKDPDTAQQASDSEDYADGDANYFNTDEDMNGKTSSADALGRTADLEDWFKDDGTSHENMREAERFNEESDQIVAEFQRSAAARQIFGGRHFTFGEQQDLIDENMGGRASQFDSLNLKNSFYEEQ